MTKKTFSARRLAIVPTLRCTLACKLCCNLMQKFDRPYDVPLENILQDIDGIFAIFDHVEWLQFVGGEIFMHKDMAAVYEYALRYKQKFDKLILMTNATIAPGAAEVAALKKYGEHCRIMISDYGGYSCKLDEMVDICEQHGIPYVVKSYHGDMQYYGGWIDNTGFDAFMGGDGALQAKIADCPQIHMENMHCLNGQLHMCSNSCFMTELGACKPGKGDYIDLHDASCSLEEKRAVIKNFYRQPVAACRICSFKDADVAKRYPAAEQIR